MMRLCFWVSRILRAATKATAESTELNIEFSTVQLRGQQLVAAARTALLRVDDEGLAHEHQAPRAGAHIIAQRSQ